MNKERFKAVEKAYDAIMDDRLSALTDLASEERDAFENMPESLQQSERGEQGSEFADSLEAAEEALYSLREALENIVFNY